MADLVHHASDDQFALALCLGAVALCGLIMHFSHHVGRLTGHIRVLETSTPVAQPRQALRPAAELPQERAA